MLCSCMNLPYCISRLQLILQELLIPFPQIIIGLILNFTTSHSTKFAHNLHTIINDCYVPTLNVSRTSFVSKQREIYFAPSFVILLLLRLRSTKH